jgi:hypothetical protein
MNSPELDRKTARALEQMIERDRDAFHYPAGAAPAISHLIERDEDLEQFIPQVRETLRLALDYLNEHYEHYFDETERDWTAGELQARLEAATSALARRTAV